MIQSEVDPATYVQGITPRHTRGRASEYFHSLLRSLPWPPVDSHSASLVTVGFTSCLVREGVSTVASQSAVAASSGNDRVLIVDGNLERPSIHKRFGIADSPGVVEFMEGNELNDSIRATSITNLWALPSGKLGDAWAPTFGSPNRLRQLLAQLKDRCDLVVFDLPPIGASDVTMPLLRQLDGVVLVIQSERVAWNLARRVAERLRRANVSLLGAVLNKHRRHVPRWLSHVR